MTPLRRLILAFATLALTLPAMADPARWQS